MTCCDEASAALRLAKSEHFDLFLLDNWLPDVTGTELTRQIRQFNQATPPILFYSAAAYQSDKKEAIKAGAKLYLTKPEAVEDLLGEVDRLINAQRAVFPRDGEALPFTEAKADRRTDKSKHGYTGC